MNANSTSLIVRPTGSFDARSVAGDPSKDAPGDIVAVELEQQCETAQGMKLFGDACVSIDDAELRNMIDEKYYKPAVTSARQFLAEAERANSQLKAEFSAWRQRMGDSDSLAIDMARDYAQQLVNAAREKTMARKRRRLIKPGRTYFESTGWLHAEAQREALFKNYPVIYLSEPSAWENPATKKRPVDPV